jgi:hypothetical protein
MSGFFFLATAVLKKFQKFFNISGIKQTFNLASTSSEKKYGDFELLEPINGLAVLLLNPIKKENDSS